ncbi:class E sortase [Kitasatospora sp. NPDC088346]|uniref:class E sortase n=1 Tax=Kitasatospora sp. NPDC088346 TaxID=3364073 RepID=UPI00382EDFB7
MRRSPRVATALAAASAAAVLAALAGCSASSDGSRAAGAPSSAAAGSGSSAPTAAPATTSPGTPSPGPASPGTPSPTATTPATPVPGPGRISPRTETASLAIPAIGLKDLPVVPYAGTTDDRPGTEIQNRGVAASPYGDRGGVGPGEVGNYLVTAHRLSAGGPLHDLPSLRVGDVVRVTSGGLVYEYEITGTRTTSFRSEQSLAEQRAAVPGTPGAQPTQAMITISTCATPEDNAAGNTWRDGNGNPEHRIDKIGVLRGRPSPATTAGPS